MYIYMCQGSSPPPPKGWGHIFRMPPSPWGWALGGDGICMQMHTNASYGYWGVYAYKCI